MALRACGPRPRPRLVAAAFLVSLLLAPLLPGSARATGAERVDWSRHADVDTVTVVTTQEDGMPRETTVWLAVVDGQGYIRTGGTRWGGDVERNRDVELVIGEERLPLRVEFVEDDLLRDRVTETFREKYGWTDRMIGIFRGGRPKIMKLLPREAAAEVVGEAAVAGGSERGP